MQLLLLVGSLASKAKPSLASCSYANFRRVGGLWVRIALHVALVPPEPIYEAVPYESSLASFTYSFDDTLSVLLYAPSDTAAQADSNNTCKQP